MSALRNLTNNPYLKKSSIFDPRPQTTKSRSRSYSSNTEANKENMKRANFNSYLNNLKYVEFSKTDSSFPQKTLHENPSEFSSSRGNSKCTQTMTKKCNNQDIQTEEKYILKKEFASKGINTGEKLTIIRNFNNKMPERLKSFYSGIISDFVFQINSSFTKFLQGNSQETLDEIIFSNLYKQDREFHFEALTNMKERLEREIRFFNFEYKGKDIQEEGKERVEESLELKFSPKIESFPSLQLKKKGVNELRGSAVVTWKPIKSLELCFYSFNSLGNEGDPTSSFNRDNTVAIGTSKGEIIIFDEEKEETIWSSKVSKENIKFLSFSSCWKYIAFLSNETINSVLSIMDFQHDSPVNNRFCNLQENCLGLKFYQLDKRQFLLSYGSNLCSFLMKADVSPQILVGQQREEIVECHIDSQERELAVAFRNGTIEFYSLQIHHNELLLLKKKIIELKTVLLKVLFFHQDMMAFDLSGTFYFLKAKREIIREFVTRKEISEFLPVYHHDEFHSLVYLEPESRIFFHWKPESKSEILFQDPSETSLSGYVGLHSSKDEFNNCYLQVLEKNSNCDFRKFRIDYS